MLEHCDADWFYVNDPASGRSRISKDAFGKSFTGVILTFEKTERFTARSSKPGLFRRLWPWFTSVRLSLFYAICTGLFLAILSFSLPLLLTLFVDQVLLGSQLDYGIVIAFSMIAAGLIIYLLTWMQGYCLRRMAVKLSVTDGNRLISHLFRLPLTFFQHRFAGDLILRFQMLDNIARSATGNLVRISVELMMSLVFFAIMLVYDVTLALVILGIGLACIVAMRLLSDMRVDENQLLRHEQGLLNGVGMGGLNNIDATRATGSENEFYSRWTGGQARELSAWVRFNELGSLTLALPGFFQILSSTAVVGIGGLKVMQGDLSLGQIMRFYVLSVNFLQPIGRLVSFADEFQMLETDIERFDDILNTEKETQPRADRSVTPGTVSTLDGRLRLYGKLEVRDVCFGYNESNKLLRNLSLTVEPGQRVAVVGSSGAGKSTLGHLIAGLHEPSSGQILFDGNLRDDIPRDVFTNSVALVIQQPTLFRGTVRDNLTLWDTTVPDEAITRAARDAIIHDEIIRRPGGYDSLLEEGGSNFSGGQRQRLEIARALVGDPAVLVLDEATSSLDPLTEVSIDNTLRRRGCTCLVIAHRLSTIRDSDRIIVLDRGEIAQSGTHDELMAEKDGIYRGLILDS